MAHRIQRSEEDRRGAFFIEEDGARVAQLTYSRSPDGQRATLHHTEVSEALRGQGVARQLVESAVQWARQEKVRVVPLCSAARAIFDKEPSFQDVLASSP